MSPELANFYKSVQAWIDSNFTFNPYYYTTYCGLCHNSGAFEAAHKLPFESLYHELQAQFQAAGLDQEVPFNMMPQDSYVNEISTGALWQNEQRLEWVRNHANA